MRMNKIPLSKNMRMILITALAIMTIAVIVLSVFLGIYTTDRGNYKTTMDNIYNMAFYDLIGSLNTIENNLVKFGVMTSDRIREETLNEVRLSAATASHAITTLASGSNSVRKLERYVNQLSDFSSVMNKKIAKGDILTSDDTKSLAKMGELAREIAVKLVEMQQSMDEDFSFSLNLGSKDDLFESILTDLQGDNNSGVEFPTLIYDGPFSDGIKDRVAKGIHGQEISEQEALSLASKYLSGYELGGVKLSMNSDYRIPSYIIEASILSYENRVATVQIAKQGGMLLSLNLYRDIEEPQLTVEDCKVVAEQYVQSIGLQNMKAVWASNNNSVVYVNLCYNDKNTIYYADMVKIKISLDTGEILGYEGLTYAFNHTERELPPVTVSEEEAVLKAPSSMQNITCRLALIPITALTEMLTWEISGTIGNERYFIYVTVATGEEIRVLRVIDSQEGELLM